MPNRRCGGASDQFADAPYNFIEGKDSEILDGKVDGDTISFGCLSGAHDVPRLEFQGKVDGDEMKLTITGTAPDGVVYQLGEVIAKRVR